MLDHRITDLDVVPMPPTRLGALSNAERWSLIVDNIAVLLADGDRAAKGLSVSHFHRLPKEEQAVYLRHALIGAMPLMAPEFVEDCREAAILRACEAYQGDSGDVVPRKLAGHMRRAWNWALPYMRGCLDGTVSVSEVVHKSSELKLILAPEAPKGWSSH